MRRKKSSIILISILTLLGTTAFIGWKLVNRSNGRLTSSGEQREYLLYVPSTYNPSEPVPLVLSIHGFTQSPTIQEYVSQWNSLADQYGFIVVYPSGLNFPKLWRVAETDLDPTAVEKEVRFFSDLLDKLSLDYTIDAERIYVNGLSNGGGMALRLACDMPDRVAAIGSVAGAYTIDLTACDGGVPGIFFHGKADLIVPIEGGPMRNLPINLPNVFVFINDYAILNGCELVEQPISTSDNVSLFGYDGCDRGSEVDFYMITDGGHTWPGGNPLPEFITGNNTYEINATQLMWDFFVEQSKQP